MFFYNTAITKNDKQLPTKRVSIGTTITNPSTAMAGTLSRYEGMRGFRTWKPYTFALQRHILSYADAHNSKNVRGYILLNKHVRRRKKIQFYYYFFSPWNLFHCFYCVISHFKTPQNMFKFFHYFINAIIIISFFYEIFFFNFFFTFLRQIYLFEK